MKILTELFKPQKLIKNLIGFLETKIELVKLDIREELYGVIIKLVVFIVFIFLLFSTITFAGITLANYLNQLFSSTFIGYGIIAIFYLLLITVAYLLRNNKAVKEFVGKQIKKHLE